MDRCPTCRARIREESRCARCGTELARLLAIETRAGLHLDRAIQYLLESSDDLACAEIEHSLQLKRDNPLAQYLLSYLMARRRIRQETGNRPATDWFWLQETSGDTRSGYGSEQDTVLP